MSLTAHHFHHVHEMNRQGRLQHVWGSANRNVELPGQRTEKVLSFLSQSFSEYVIVFIICYLMLYTITCGIFIVYIHADFTGTLGSVP